MSLWPFQVVGEGKDLTLLQLNPGELEALKITVITKCVFIVVNISSQVNYGDRSGHGIFPVYNDMEEFSHFNVGEGKQAMVQ